MAKLTGTIQKSDLEGGHWLLVTAKGEQYQLVGAKGVKAGQEVVVEGTVDRGAMGIGMTGPTFTVKKISPKK
ncbi:MAG: hypothetical protein IPH44_23000 [Myxococcales bacterium]|jgi:hypothetical protein|nr:hypothetical protein [Myxococcales bacterium]MBK7192227.1 hypothetical protein [Myxococcales bacterium]MBP6848858.1 hypothetical protein [Kofleriaceae bacterium]